MIKQSFREAFRLVRRSRMECLIYLSAIGLSAVLVIVLCRLFGFDYPLRSPKLEVAKLAYLAAFSAPGFIITVWLGAGLIGRISMDALKGAPDSMVNYANGWFLRNLTGSIIITSGAFLPICVFAILPTTLAVILMLTWFLIFIWLAIRISLWSNIMFMEGLNPIAAMKHSYRVSRGHAIPVAVLSLPVFAGGILGIGLAHFTSGNIILIQVLKALLIGLATLIRIGALAAGYLTIKRESGSAADAEGRRTTIDSLDSVCGK